jgi:hypothetical protein
VLVRQFLNTYDVEEGADEIRLTGRPARWLAGQGLPSGPGITFANNGELLAPEAVPTLNSVGPRM